MNRRAVFLDRDGTLNRERGFITSPQALELLPGVREAVQRLDETGFVLAVCTNQSGIAKELYTESDLAQVHQLLHRELEQRPKAYFHCPHHPERWTQSSGYGGTCDCRKPKAGLLHQAAELLNLSFDGSYLIGDTARDLLAGNDLGLRRILVQSGKPWQEAAEQLKAAGQVPDLVCADLGEAVDWILAKS